MNHRQTLKTALFAPLLGLFKSRKSTGLTKIPPTSGTSSEGPFYAGDLPERLLQKIDNSVYEKGCDLV